jgi:UDP:flavonoid glycosyltransferase YjiC (YdhE family)
VGCSLGVAISLEPGKRSPEEVLGAIRSLSTVPSYRLRSRALAAAAAGYDAPATSADAVEELLVMRGAAYATPEGGLAKSHEARS